MKLHHIGLACRDIEKERDHMLSWLPGCTVSEVVFDPAQEAYLCMIHPPGGTPLELVSGRPVAKLVERGGGPYHICYEVDDLAEAEDRLHGEGGIPEIPATPAKLFDGRRVVFYLTNHGLVELLEAPVPV